MVKKLEEIILEYQERIRKKKYYPRFIKYNIKDVLKIANIKAITGPRRAGKTTLAMYIGKSTYKEDEILYVDWEDERLINVNVDLLLESYLRLYSKKPKLIIFDEVQELKMWERVVKRLYEEGYNIIITGSNAKLLSSDLSTALGGRVFEIELLPFSFKEFIDNLTNINYQKEYTLLKNKERILKKLEEYLRYGGFFEVLSSPYKDEVISQIVSGIIYRDINYRYNADINVIRLILLKLVENTGKEYKIVNLKKKIKPFVDVSIPTIISYVQILQNTYLVFNIKNYLKSFQKREVSRKTYFVDTGIITHLSLETDLPKLMENQVFLELRRRGKEIYYYKTKEGYEVDFLIKERTKIKELLQVSYANSYEEINEREIRALLHAKEDLKLSKEVKLTVITWDYEDEREVEWWKKKGKIRFVPLWRWLLV